MEASLSKEIFNSRPCVFVVGEDKREFLLHSDLIKRKSEALGKLTDISFAEGRNGYVVLRDDDVETFSAFAQFIYTGDYHLSFDMSAPDRSKESHDEGNHGNNVAQLDIPITASGVDSSGKLEPLRAEVPTPTPDFLTSEDWEELRSTNKAFKVFGDATLVVEGHKTFLSSWLSVMDELLDVINNVKTAFEG
ncbi:hypothetical protein E4U32_007478 [Claviceps aff. humidiphila group G2b]|nr:hypothetical protein E4U32_007478 [Claviceps aff. humidiphila group G2b]